jgi:hypothetical protein
MTLGARVAIEVHSASGIPSRPTSVVGQAAPSSWKRTLTGPDGPRYGVLSDDAVSPCIVAVPTGPAAGFAGGSGPNACAEPALRNSEVRLVAMAARTALSIAFSIISTKLVDNTVTAHPPNHEVPRVLLVGPYERDNVGDLLFLLVTERYLPGAQITVGAPFDADMTALLDREVHAYGPLLRRQRFDAVWTVGGQVGAVDLARAFRMSAPDADYEAFVRGSRLRRRAMLRRAAGGRRPPISPYMPAPTARTASVLNSVGLSGIRDVERPRRDALISILRGQSLIAVRDRISSSYLDELGIEHRLVPDAVHALGVLRPGDRDPDSDVAIFQASRRILRKLGHERVAARLAHARHFQGLKLRLLMAGTARGHDTIDDYERLADLVKRESPGADIEILRERRPYDIVDQIQHARVVIGTSLHVRIIASAYGVPRVTLVRNKPTGYSRTWDADMPHNIAIDHLDEAVEAALASAHKPEVAARSAELSHLAHEHLGDVARRVMSGELKRELAATNAA